MSPRGSEVLRYDGKQPSNMAELADKMRREADTFEQNGETAKAEVRRDDADRVEVVAAAMYKRRTPTLDEEHALQLACDDIHLAIGSSRALSLAALAERVAKNLRIEIQRPRLLYAHALRTAVALREDSIDMRKAVGT